MAKAYKETRQREEELKRIGKLSMEPLPRKGSRRRELPVSRIKADVYVSTVKEEQLHKLAKMFKVPKDIDFHLPTPSCRPSKPPPGFVDVCLDNFDAGLRLPLCGLYRCMFHALNITPFLLNLNVY